MLFIPVWKNAIEVWQCSDMYGTASHLVSAAEVDCGTSSIATKRVVSVVSMVVYVLGVPLLYTVILQYGHRHKRLSDPKFQAKVGAHNMSLCV